MEWQYCTGERFRILRYCISLFQYCIGVLEYCGIDKRFGVAVSSDQREPMLPSRRPSPTDHNTLYCKLPLAKVPGAQYLFHDTLCKNTLYKVPRTKVTCAFSYLNHNTLCKIPCAITPCAFAYRSIVSSWIRGSALAALSHPSRHSGISHTRSSVMPA